MSDRSVSSNKPRASRSAARANRAQVRAMHARAASTRLEQFSEDDRVAAADAVARNAAAAAVGRKRPAVRQIFLTRQQEYQFIRDDMRRLIITAAALFVLMIVMLFILD